MNAISLNGNWKLHWSTGQRGGAPYVLKHQNDHDVFAEFRGSPRTLAGSYNEAGWLDAAVPGEVHLDLMRAGLLDDPRIGINIFKARWVEETVWYYRRTIDIPEEWLRDRLYLHFEELDLSAIIYINGKEAARHENMFLPLLFRANDFFHAGENELVVRMDSGLFNVCDRPIRDKYSASQDVGLLLTKRMWMRKPQYESEWDWSPRLLNVGISGNVSLLRDPALVISHFQVRQSVSADLASASVTSRVFLPEGEPIPEDCRLEMTVDGKSIVSEGLSAALTLDHPALWYPVGYGEQPLYPVSLTLWQGERMVWHKETEIGFRRVDVDQSPHPETGRYFTIRVNQIPVFVKGSNLVPLSLFPGAVTAEDYDRLTDRAREANMNMLRVWGGGLYERDALYNLCDRKGLLLWQEFISACAYPPVEEDETLHLSMLEEARYQARRLSRHPSLIVWCGNNELSPFGHALFTEEYPAILKEEDPEKYYQPASPYSPDGNEDCWAETVGDQHPWGVGFLEKDHRKYRDMVCRFPNEGGILGPVNRRALSLVTDLSGDYTASQAYMAHDNMLAFMKEGSSPDEDLRFWTGLLPSALSAEQYIAAGGYVQGEGLSEYIDNFRRRAFSSSSAIFWMFNDCWPASRSWTILDDEGRRNPAFYHVKRAFAPIRLVFSEEGDGVTLWGVNDSCEDCRAGLTAGCFLSDGKEIRKAENDVLLPARRVTKLAFLPHSVAEKEARGSLPIPFAMLTDEKGGLIARARFLSHRYHEYALSPASISVAGEGEETVYLSDRYVMGVCIDLDGEERLSDNLFDLYPGIPYRVKTAGHDEVLYTLNDILLRS